MAYTLDVGKTELLAISYLDQDGKEMLPAPTPDAPPVWSQLTPASETLTAAADGNTATAVGLAAGTDTVEVDLTVGGISFKATIDATINVVAPPAQVLTSIAIVATPVP